MLKRVLHSILFLLFPATAFAQSAGCEKLMVFDTTKVSTDFASRYSYLQTVKQASEMDSSIKADAKIMSYFQGSWDQFERERKEYESLIKQTGSVAFHQEYFRHALSSAGAQAYADCVAKNNSNALSAWIAKESDDFITVEIRNGLSGSNAKTTYTVIGDKPLNTPKALESGAKQALKFKKNPKKDFDITIESHTKSTGADDSISITLPKKRFLAIHRQVQELRMSAVCGAGFNGNSAGKPYSAPGTFVAPVGYYLDDPTTSAVLVSKENRGVGLASWRMEWGISRDPNTNQIIGVTGTPAGCNGNDGDNGGSANLIYKLNAYKVVLKEFQSEEELVKFRQSNP